jgi:hypothetical protein
MPVQFRKQTKNYFFIKQALPEAWQKELIQLHYQQHYYSKYIKYYSR